MNQCLRCLGEGVDSLYIGESAWSPYERAKEHMDDYRGKKDASHMWKHVATKHQADTTTEFRFSVIRRFQTAMTRQISEAVRIRRLGGEDSLLNSLVPASYNRCSLPRLVVKYNNNIVGDGDGGIMEVTVDKHPPAEQHSE